MSAAYFSSIAPYLPLQVDRSSGSLRWLSAVEYALKAVARGPETSDVTSALALYDCIEDIRTENGDLKPLSPQIAVGLSCLCDEVDAEEFFGTILPNIARLAIKLPDLLKHHEREIKRLPGVGHLSVGLRVLSPLQSGIVLLHQHLIAALLACAFFCLFPDDRGWRKVGLVNINFDGLYRKVGRNMPEGTVSFERKVLPRKKPLPTESHSVSDDSCWSHSKQPLCGFKVLANGAIEDAGPDYLQIDFANEQLGGGALHSGCVQEEIRFMISPECIAGMLFMPTMTDSESIEITGAETYSKYTGYGQSFCFAGDHFDNTPRDSWGRRRTCIGAIDALCLPGESQFEDELMIRELDKAYCGFLNHSTLCGYAGAPDVASSEIAHNSLPVKSVAIPDSQDSELSGPFEYDANYEVRLDRVAVEDRLSCLNEDKSSSKRSHDTDSAGTCVLHHNHSGVATGNWGAGAFGGNLQLKSLLQWLAASQAGCSMVLYYSFGDARTERLQEVVEWILKEDWCVLELWTILQRYGKCRMQRQVRSELYDWILPQTQVPASR